MARKKRLAPVWNKRADLPDGLLDVLKERRTQWETYITTPGPRIHTLATYADEDGATIPVPVEPLAQERAIASRKRLVAARKDATASWDKYRAKQSARSKAGVETKRDARARADAARLSAVLEYRKTHPGCRLKDIARHFASERLNDRAVRSEAARIKRLEDRARSQK